MLYRRVNRAFTAFKKVAWVAVPAIAVGGLFYTWLGFAVIGIMLALMGLSLFRGKYWCGHVCPHGSLFDVAVIRVSAMRKIPDLFRMPVLKWGFFGFFMVMFGVRLAGALGRLGEPPFFDRLGMVFVLQYLIFPTILGLVLAVFVNPRTWCSLCPMGTMQELMYRAGTRLGVNRRADLRVTWVDRGRCTRCGHCARVCPVQLEPYRELEKGEKGFHRACIKCSTCVEHCPTRALQLVPAQQVQSAAGDRSLRGEGSRP